MKRLMFGLLLVAIFLVPGVFAEDIPVITAKDLVSLFRENEIRFNKNFLNKKIQVTGELENVGMAKGAPSLTLKDGSLFGMFTYCRTSELDVAADLNKGDTVTVVGTCDVALGKITLSDCVIKAEE